jgi:8-oxo-dGTP pyrophosphatase MutT (NUDIX family)
VTQPPPDRTAEYRSRDLHEEGAWPPTSKPRYGGVVFNSRGEVLLREPLNHFDGYVWTFPKGAVNTGEHPVDTALREVFEETGSTPAIIGHLVQGFVGGVTGSTNFYYLMFANSDTLDTSAVLRNRETASVQWVSPDEARRLISLSTNTGGRKRDLATLDAAIDAYASLTRARHTSPKAFVAVPQDWSSMSEEQRHEAARKMAESMAEQLWPQLHPESEQ